MRAMREQPRVAIAKTLVALCLVAVGVAIGVLLDDGGRESDRAAEVRLVGAERTAHERQTQLRATRAAATKTEAALTRAERHARRVERESARLRRDVRAAERKRRRAKRQP